MRNAHTRIPGGGGYQVADGVYCCGDHRGTATLNGAIASGRAAARAVVAASKTA